jgi:ribosomal protein S18 acetylase RimI-like enzyme
MTPYTSSQSGSTANVLLREAGEHDAPAIAALHADSWRRHYRGAFLDSYLDGDIVPERLRVWTGRLTPPRLNQYTVCAELDGDVVGFAHVDFGQDPKWGALVDNLHVTSARKGSGIGTQLLSAAAQELVRSRPSETLYLWVLDQNVAAQAFYDARGGTRVETTTRGPFPGGGRAAGHRYYWADPRLLIGGTP